MNIITIPKKIAGTDDLVIIPRKEYEALRRFIREGGRHLKQGGEILLGAGGPSRHDIIYGEAKKSGFTIEVAEEREMVVDKIGNAKLKVMLYRLSPITS